MSLSSFAILFVLYYLSVVKIPKYSKAFHKLLYISFSNVEIFSFPKYLGRILIFKLYRDCKWEIVSLIENSTLYTKLTYRRHICHISDNLLWSSTLLAISIFRRSSHSFSALTVFIGFCLTPTQPRPPNPHQPPILFIILLFASLILDISMEFRYTCVVVFS